MALEDCYPVTREVCEECVAHIEYGCTGRECIVFGPDPDATICASHKRLQRRLLRTDAVEVTQGCVRESDDDHDCTDTGFTYNLCDLCGADGGHREHVTTWHRQQPVRTLTRNGWDVHIHDENGCCWVGADRDGDRPRSMFNVPLDGAERYARLTMFVSTLPA